jgi:HEPN domain-containing protein
MLKAVIAKRTNEFAPRLHNLMRLADYASLQVPAARADFIRELSAYYIQARYPDEIENLSSQVSRQMAEEMLDKTEEVIQWLSSIH